MSHGSLKDTVKTIQTTFIEGNAQTLSPLPDELQQTIEAFLERNQDIDEHDAQKLHDELLSIHNKHVATSPDKLSAFVHVLRLLQPAIRGERRLEDWWQLVIRPVVDAIGHKRDTIEDAREFLLGILVFDDDDDKSGLNATLSAKFTGRVMESYMTRSKLPTLEGEEISPENEFIAQELESILVAFGKKKPLELLQSIDVELLKKDRRLQALSLLSSFVRLQPPHLHLVLQTSIISHLHNCLLIDLSGTVVDMALTILIMFMPHITSSLYSSLPKLFLIYARISCWDHYNNETSEKPKDGDESPNEKSSSEGEGQKALEMDAGWEPLHRLFNTVEAIVPKANYLFTFLYGLFPLNFMAFVRKPRRYLKMKNYPKAEDLNLFQDLIRKRTETHRVSHRLHPSFFTTTPEDELTDNRLLKVDPADLVTECLALVLPIAISSWSDPGPPPTAKLPELPRGVRKKLSIRSDALLSPDDESVAASPTTTAHNSWRHTTSTNMTAFTSPSSNYPDVSFPLPPRSMTQPEGLSYSMSTSRDVSPRPIEGTSPPKDGLSSRPGSRHRSLKKAYSPPSDVGQFDAVPKLQVFAQALSRSPRNSQSAVTPDSYSTAVLQREVMLLKNDLNFERFQKAQYLAQIGQLQRKNLNEATSESQTQTLLNKNRTLSDRLKKADDLYAQLKKETAMSRSQSKKYEDQLSMKLRTYREEEKQRQGDVQMLRHELDMAKQEVETLRKLVIESESHEREARNQLNTLTIDLEAMNNLRQRLLELESKIREYELAELDVDRAQEDHDLLRTELEAAQLTIDSRDAELDRSKKTYEQKVVALENRLRTISRAPAPPNAQLPESVQQMIDSALAASSSKYLQIKKNYKRLNERYIELEVKFQELETGCSSPTSTMRPGSVLSLTRYAGEDTNTKMSSLSGPGRIHSISSRRLHAFSDPNSLLEEEASAEEEMPPSHSAHRNISRNTNYASKSRYDSLANLRPVPARGISPPSIDRSPYDTNFTHDFQANTTAGQRQSVQALDLNTRKGPPGPEVRVHGRGGAGRKAAPKPDVLKKKDDKPAKTGGFRGLKGIM